MEPVQTGLISSAALKIDPNHHYLYASNRGLFGNPNNSISICSIDSDTGILNLVENVKTGGLVPRDFTIHPNGEYILVAHQDSDDISVFERDPKTGQIGKLVNKLDISTPVCLQFFNESQ